MQWQVQETAERSVRRRSQCRGSIHRRDPITPKGNKENTHTYMHTVSRTTDVVLCARFIFGSPFCFGIVSPFLCSSICWQCRCWQRRFFLFCFGLFFWVFTSRLLKYSEKSCGLVLSFVFLFPHNVVLTDLCLSVDTIAV